MDLYDNQTIKLLADGDELSNEVTFERLFKSHFKALHAYAYTIVNDEITAEEMVQTVFLKIWEKKEQLQVETSIKAYLYRAVHNCCMNYIKHQKIKSSYQEHITYSMKNEFDDASKKVQLSELETRLRAALNELPEQCRTIFQLSRFDELKYREIAAQLGLSPKTVENQMGKALKILRLKLADFLPVAFWFFVNLLSR
ncbi:RNA polymerase sigma-70 factor [Solitalea canadensis]|uniref:RNA polymerase sigma-70 factor, Bacteroides expansion family 1 n=1 Tax=Solitalea canadensis (strain ATCC 29591 / DSM 3403 / JCM 21819 / LMG 8368 / NBRC 15130 / NCIMB 12057 / USAM 9D) TaxID=929556 RepID=H8KR60_SOLCM|nr:RNA polymerase sigma-70 factor [Solitalea canadensis]AFD07266.1 RNA polymerase sigma-70 factor, Bacteroides expansion family 1 [Solitalea canadensis DSM 3403]